MVKAGFFLTLSTLALVQATASFAQSASWTGAESSDWNDQANWAGGTVPEVGTVTIQAGPLNPAIASGVQFTGAWINIGQQSGSQGHLAFTNGSSVQLGTVNVGSSGNGTLVINNSDLMATGSVAVGSMGQGHLILTGPQAELSVMGESAHLNIGNQNGGYGHLEILNGASVSARNMALGNLRGAGRLTVDGAGSRLNIDGRDLSAAGQSGDVDIIVRNGGQIDIHSTGAPQSYGLLQLGSNGHVTRLFLDGEGSALTSTGNALIAEFGTVQAVVTDGARLETGAHLIVGDGRRFHRPQGQLLVAGGAEAVARGDTVIGVGSGTGSLTLASGGQLISTGGVYLGAGGNANGFLNIGAAAEEEAAMAGIINAPMIEFGTGQARLTFNHSDTDYVFSTDFHSWDEGTHVIEHIAGTTHLAADGSGYTGTTTLRGGQLLVGGLAGTGSLGGQVDVHAGGLLGGTGTLTGDVTVESGGTISAGNSAQIGTLTIGGDLTFASSSGYLIHVDPLDNDRSDLLKVGGTATLTGGTALHIGLNEGYRPNATWTILTAEAGISGAFDQVHSKFAFLDPRLEYDATNVFLTLTRNDLAFCLDGMTANQCRTGNGIESAGTETAIHNAVISLDSAAAAQAFDHLSGEIHQSVKTALIEESRFIREAVSDRLRPANTARAKVTDQGDTASRHGWGRIYAAHGRMDGNGNAAQLERSAMGLLGGFDGETADGMRLGLLAGAGHSSFHLNDRASSAASNNLHLGIYGGAEMDRLRVGGGMSFSRHDLTTDRTVDLSGLSDQLASRYRAKTLQIFGQAAWHIATPTGSVEPFIELAHVQLRSDAVEEEGEDAALSVTGGKIDTTFTTLGLRAASQLRISGVAATVEGSLGWRHAFGDLLPSTGHSFATGTPFLIDGNQIDRNLAVINAGVALDLSPSKILKLSYYGLMGSDSRDHGLNAVFAMRF